MQVQKTQIADSSTDTTDRYVPSSSDKKRAIMMYLFFGIMVGMIKKEMNSFEYYHIKQAIGRRIVFLLILIFDIILLFIPFIKYIGLIPLIVMIVIRFISVRQSRNGVYFINKNDSPLALFSGMGAWFINLFELDITNSQNIKDGFGGTKFVDKTNN